MKKLIVLLLAALLLVLPLGGLAESVSDSPYTVFDGINLTGELTGDEIEMTLVYQSEDGTNFAEYVTDALIVVSYERLLPTEGMDAARKAVETLLAGQGVEPLNMNVSDDAAVSARLGLAAYRMTYAIGQGVDACQALDIYIEAGEWAYRFHTLTPDNHYESYRVAIEGWIDSLMLEEITGPQPYGEQAIDAYPRLEMPSAAIQTELVDFEQYSEIEYEQWYACDEGKVLFSYERFMPCANDVDAVIQATTGMYDSVSGLTAAQDMELTGQLAYPAYRVEYLTGEGDDSLQNVDIFMLMDECALCFHVEIGADMYADYQQVIEGWIDMLSIVNAAK